MSPKLKKIIIATALIFCWFVFDSLIVFAFTSNATKDQLNANITFQRQTIERWPLLFPNQLEVRRGFWDKIRLALFVNEDTKRLYSDRYRLALTFYENSKGLLHQAETSFQHADYPNATEYLRLTINSLLAADLLYGSAHEVWNGNLVEAQKTLYTICHDVNSVVAGKAFGGIARIVGSPALGLAINIEMESGIKNVCNDQFSVSKRNLKDVIITSISAVGTKIVGNLFGKAIERTIEVIEKLPLVSKVIAPSFPERKQPDEIVDDFLRREELFKDFSSGNGTTVVNKTQEQLSNSTTSQQPPSMAINKQEQLRQVEEAKKKQAEEEKKRLETEIQKQEDQRKIEEQRHAQATAEEALKKAKNDEERRMAEEARKKAEQARIAAQQELQKRQEETLRQAEEERKKAEQQRAFAAVNPYLLNTPVSGPIGTTFFFEGGGFMPRGIITEVITKPDGVAYTSSRHQADDNGRYSKNADSASMLILGTYTIYWIDNTTGKMSNIVSEMIMVEGSQPIATSNSELQKYNSFDLIVHQIRKTDGLEIIARYEYRDGKGLLLIDIEWLINEAKQNGWKYEIMSSGQ
ncbi:MAG: cell envelope integrity protein TolA [bacterium]|nr:cell envelope integrity protein TolA [bacterium]